MKKLIILLYLITASLPVPAQNFQEWWQQKKTKKQYLAEQIAALYAYGTVLKKGYELSEQGLGLIHTIKSGDFTQHQNHFQSFSTVNSAVKNHSAVQHIILLSSIIHHTSLETRQQLKQSRQFSQSEEAVVAHAFLNIEKKTDQLLRELQLVLQNDLLSLSDSERINRMEQLQLQMRQIHGFSTRFGQEALQLAVQRKQETQSIAQSGFYHNLHQP
ncbi:hypothetical protein J2X69_005036 [Algoriphagus sp. 4150]|uniref:hypothetical protein n=1 Tax=Algoriphagus sp. 4150 TaxID=2817756 RepID=UPI00285E129B|nr:hypothetical protein [Algoriphagus sp. 4150]MDR7132662.1 hypothetical protein [Algoriphagus sp. 4150]